MKRFKRNARNAYRSQVNFQHTNVVTFTRPGWHVVCEMKIVPLDQNTRLFSINICEGTKEMRIQLTRPLLPLPWEIRDVEMQMTPKVVKLQLSLGGAPVR